MKARFPVRWRGLVTVLVALAATVGTFSLAQSRSLRIRDFDAQIAVHRDASIAVTEMIDVEFQGSWQGIYRTIPVQYRTPKGFNYTLMLHFDGAYDETGHKLKAKVSRQGHYRQIKVWVPDAHDTERRIVLKYHVDNALQFFEDHDELYWNITGDEWDFPIEGATATVSLPDGAKRVRATVYTGAYGEREKDATVTVDGSQVHFALTRPLDYHEGMTAVVGWEKGLIEEPGALAKFGMFVRSNWPLIIPILAFVLMFRLWYTKGRDPKLRPISVQYDPPDKLTPAEAGTLIDNSADMRDITATVVDLAVKGFVVIEESEKAQLLGLFHSTEYTFHLQKNAEEWGTLKDHERSLLDALFDGGNLTTVDMSDLENKFYRYLPGIRSDIFSSLVAHRYYVRRPDQVLRGYVFMGIVLGGLIIAGGLTMGFTWGISELVAVISGGLTAIIIAGFGLIMPARTNEGARALEGILGFSEFLERVESDKYERVDMTPDLFERFLPYAMAFGVEKKWASAFDGISQSPPSWYRGGSVVGGFRPYLFAAALNNMGTRAAHAMASAPRSKGGGSGFGGGGSSGGGFGGGGGGGF